MPNRLIKDSIYESEKVNALSDFQFRVWVSLIPYVDDYGRGDARPAIIKGRCFPLRRMVSEEDIRQTLVDLEKADCIRLYIVGGKPFLCFPRWAKHQTIRNQRSKYPAPEDADADNPHQIANACDRLNSTASIPNSTPTKSDSEIEGIAAVDNPFGYPDTAAQFTPDPLVIYASNNLLAMNADNMDELLSFRDSLPDELIRHAINEACGAGVRRYKYVKAILNRYVESGFKTVADAKADEAKHQKGAQEPEQYADEDDFY